MYKKIVEDAFERYSNKSLKQSVSICLDAAFCDYVIDTKPSASISKIMLSCYKDNLEKLKHYVVQLEICRGSVQEIDRVMGLLEKEKWN